MTGNNEQIQLAESTALCKRITRNKINMDRSNN